MAILLTAGIAVLDFVVVPASSIGFLYLFPILIVAGSLDRWTLLAFALICDVLREQFSPNSWSGGADARFITALIAYFGAGLFVSELVRHRRTAMDRGRELAREVARRQAAEQQLRGVVDGSPAAILTINPQGKILMANEAAYELLKCEPQTLAGHLIDDYIPMLATFRQPSSLRRLARTMIECTAQRFGGETFLAHVWVSSAGPPLSTGLSAVVFDASEQLRSSEEVGLHTLALSARVILGTFWHETRNFCTAMRVLTNNLKRNPDVGDVEEVEGLDSLVSGLERLASAELHPEADETGLDLASLRAVLDQFRIVIEPWFQDSQVEVTWQTVTSLPLVRADHHALLQVFLNLARNARREIEQVEQKRLAVRAVLENSSVIVRFHNSGPPVPDPSTLFQPFQQSAAGSGIGLHVSRAIVRSFGGDLRYEAVPEGCCFAVVLESVHRSEIYGEKNA
ncbi:MAG TPA: ATP-binding protein [Bryobacteraceae bacterium]